MVTGRRKLLLADDSITIQKVVALTFADEGLEVVAVGDGEQALSQLEAGSLPDVVLADVFMPGLGGYEVCRRIKTDGRFRHIPVMLLVGSFEPFNEAEARRVGADDVLTKPFQSIRGLVNKVGALLGGSEAKPEEKEQPPEPVRETNEDEPRGRAVEETSWSRSVAAQDTDAPEEFPSALEPDPSASFADLGMDDQMIEATPAESYGDMPEKSSDAQRSTAAFASAQTAYGDPAPLGLSTHAEIEADDWPGAEQHAQTFVAAPEESGEESRTAHPAFASQSAAFAASDDALLDLGTLDSSVTVAADEADDFILDLDDDNPPPRTFSAPPDLIEIDAAPFDEPQTAVAATSTSPDAAGAFAEASHGEAVAYAPEDFDFSSALVEEPVHEDAGEVAAEVVAQDASQDYVAQHSSQVYEVPALPYEEGEMTISSLGPIEPTVVPAEEPVPASVESTYTDGSVEGDTAKPPASGYVEEFAAAPLTNETMAADESPAAAPRPADASAPAAGGQLIGLEQLSPEAVEAIARRAVELLSERVVREIAWDVVPDLAELIIKRRLDEESGRR